MLLSSAVSSRVRALVVSLGAFAVALATLFVATPAVAAPTLTLVTGTSNPTRTGATRNSLRNAVSYQDCVDNISMTFTVSAGVGTFMPGTDTAQVWAGVGNCVDTTNRATATAGTCQPVSVPVSITNTTFTLTVSARDLVYAASGKTSPGNGGLVTPFTPQTDVSICSSRTDPAASPMNVAILDFTPGANDAAASVVYTAAPNSGLEITVDTVGPPVPTGLSPGVGDGLIILNWTPAVSTDIAGYRIFCDPSPGHDPALAPSLPDGSAVATCDASATTPDASAPVDSSVPIDGEAGASDSGSAPVDSGSATCPSTSDAGNVCSSAVIINGINGNLINSDYYLCGTTDEKTASTLTVKSLTNDTKYTFGIAARDPVGNIGSVGVFPCATPAPIDDFWNKYKEAGGGAGGTFCALEAVGLPVPASMTALSLLIAGLALARRRRDR